MFEIIDEELEYREAVEFARTGARAQATITSVTYGGVVNGLSVWRMGMRVEPDGLDAFSAELAIASIAYDAEWAPWRVGNTATVVYNPADPARVRFLPPGE